MSLFGLEIGKKSIMAQQAALEVTGHNVANANTDGYTRQLASLQTTRPHYAPGLTADTKAGQMGTGVKVAEIERIRDAFLDAQVRKESKTSGYWEAVYDSLAKIEVILNEPSEEGLRAVMDMFWESWQDLSVNPESEAVRAVVAQRGMALADAFNHTYRQLSELREDINSSVEVKVDEINSIAEQITDLNQQILAINIAGKQPNDLEDKRDLLLDQLSKIIDIDIRSDANGMVTVQMGGRALVQGVEYAPLATETDGQGMYMVIWQDTKVKARITGGELRGLLDARGKTELSQENSPSEYKEIVPDLIEKINTLAKTIIVQTNDLHRGGYSLNNKTAYPDGEDFFDLPEDPDNFEDWAEFMQVSDSIMNDVKNIAAASHRTWDDNGNKVNFGDGANALKIAQLKHYLNNDEYWVKTMGLAVDFNDSNPVSINFEYPAGTFNTVDIDPISSYSDLREIADAIAEELEAAGLAIEVRTDGGELVFYSNNDQIQSISFISGGMATVPPDTFETGQSAGTASGMVKYVTADDYWRSLAADVGVQAQEAVRMVENQEVLLNQLENKRQSVSGVSLDEEMSNLIKFQHAYNAAARYITAIDEELDIIINRMGQVGR